MILQFYQFITLKDALEVFEWGQGNLFIYFLKIIYPIARVPF